MVSLQYVCENDVLTHQIGQSAIRNPPMNICMAFHLQQKRKHRISNLFNPLFYPQVKCTRICKKDNYSPQQERVGASECLEESGLIPSTLRYPNDVNVCALVSIRGKRSLLADMIRPDGQHNVVSCRRKRQDGK